MNRVRTFAARLFAATDGQDLVEYATVAALIAIVALTAVTTLGQTIHDVLWSGVAASI